MNEASTRDAIIMLAVTVGLALILGLPFIF